MDVELRHFEDFRVGDRLDLGRRPVTRDEIIAFATEFDPQPMHVDEEAGARSLLGGLAASGWHTASLLMRQLVDELLSRSASLGSPGIERLSWLAPVRPGDELVMSGEIIGMRRSQSRPEIGIVKIQFEVATAAGQAVMTMTAALMIRCRGGVA